MLSWCARNKPIRFSSSSLSDFRVVYPCGTSPLSTACITLGYASEGRPRRYVLNETMCTWTADAKGLVGYRHTPTAPKMGARTGAMAATKSSTSARVRSAICCGKGNHAVSRGICWSELCSGWDWSTPTNRPEANTKVENSQCWIDARMRSNWAE